jgi:DNA invertase Pin-like site-specific DNA recombinase
MMAKVICRGYIRVSTTMQSEDGISLETQYKRLQAHCEYKGWNLVKVYTDAGISGKNMDRPGLQSLLSDIQANETVLICELSRMSRTTKDALTIFELFKEKGANFVCLSPDMDFGTPIGQMMLTVLCAVHQLERQNISAHVSNNMTRLSKEGKLRSRPPYGYKFVGKDKDLEPEPAQQTVLENIKIMHAGGMNLAQIAKQLNERGDNLTLLNNRKTIPEKIPVFHAQTIKRILVDHGILVPVKPVKRLPLEQRITSHHKPVPNNMQELIPIPNNIMQDLVQNPNPQ